MRIAPVVTSAFAFIVVLAGFSALPAMAETPRFPQRRGAEAWQPTLPPCQCRALGRSWSMGAEACLETGQGRRLHVCAMQQNVTHWEPSARTCPES